MSQGEKKQGFFGGIASAFAGGKDEKSATPSNEEVSSAEPVQKKKSGVKKATKKAAKKVAKPKAKAKAKPKAKTVKAVAKVAKPKVSYGKAGGGEMAKAVAAAIEGLAAKSDASVKGNLESSGFALVEQRARGFTLALIATKEDKCVLVLGKKKRGSADFEWKVQGSLATLSK